MQCSGVTVWRYFSWWAAQWQFLSWSCWSALIQWKEKLQLCAAIMIFLVSLAVENLSSYQAEFTCSGAREPTWGHVTQLWAKKTHDALTVSEELGTFTFPRWYDFKQTAIRFTKLWLQQFRTFHFTCLSKLLWMRLRPDDCMQLKF